ncbi:MAG: type II toxin-antitoxin system RelE family toxin [Methylohalobius sp. ZOD2]|nr:type II toxin-antitoxin system RelE/ParE family toxin [Methylothermaceae bacterium]
MAYEIELAASAKKQFDKLPANIRQRLAKTINQLSTTPRPPGVTKLKGEDQLYRVRVGDYRIVYRIEDNRLLVLILKVGHRRAVYR